MATKKTAAAKKSPIKTGLKQEIVIAAGEDLSAITGAQRIAPEHSPRGHGGIVRAPDAWVRPSTASPALQHEVEQFLYCQAQLLDGKYWQDYINLFAHDGVYWMPALPHQTDWQGEPSIFAEDKLMMEIRMGRVSHPNAWSQAPLWGTNHIVGNVVIESATAKKVVVRSSFQMMELRRDTVRHFGGTYRHTLVRDKTGLRIQLQRVDAMNGQAPYDYVLQVWV
jgi:3-phenylpropionate/cinnamic acid dioxygenase small subunit